jgi:hypothetical protein
VEVCGITEAWEEDTWDWRTEISHDNIIWGMADMLGVGWVDIEVTDLVTDWVSRVKENDGMVLVSPSGEHWSKYISKDNTAYPDYVPYLEIKFPRHIVPDHNHIIRGLR